MGTHYQLLLGIHDERTWAPSLLLVSVDQSGLLSFSGESEDSNNPSRWTSVRFVILALGCLHCATLSLFWTVIFLSLSSQKKFLHVFTLVTQLIMYYAPTHIMTHKHELQPRCHS